MQENVRSVAERVQAATRELKGLEQIIVSGDFSPRILTEFRNAVLTSEAGLLMTARRTGTDCFYVSVLTRNRA